MPVVVDYVNYSSSRLYYGIGYYCEFAESNAINRFGIKNKKNRSKPFGFEIIFRRKKNKYTLSEKTWKVLRFFFFIRIKSNANCDSKQMARLQRRGHRCKTDTNNRSTHNLKPRDFYRFLYSFNRSRWSIFVVLVKASNTTRLVWKYKKKNPRTEWSKRFRILLVEADLRNRSSMRFVSYRVIQLQANIRPTVKE